MKLYHFPFAPNPRKVRLYIAEKGFSIDYEEVDLLKGENRTPEFLSKNAMGSLPGQSRCKFCLNGSCRSNDVRMRCFETGCRPVEWLYFQGSALFQHRVFDVESRT